MPIQKALISYDRAGEQRATDGCDNDLGNRTRREMLGYLALGNQRHVFQGSPLQVDARTTKLKVVSSENNCQNLAGVRESFQWVGSDPTEGSGIGPKLFQIKNKLLTKF